MHFRKRREIEMFDFLKGYECPICHKRHWTGSASFQCCQGTAARAAYDAKIRNSAIRHGIDPDIGRKLKNPPKMNQGELSSFETYTVECNWCNGTGKKNGLPCDWCGGSGRLPRP
jgi:hypothetical protein